MAEQITDASPIEQRLQLGMLAAQVEIAARLAGIEKSLDVGLKVYTE
ncbi:hypothetical protein [Nonomuraea sp. KM88]